MNVPDPNEKISVPILNKNLFLQVAEKIEQGVWVRDLGIDQIIYVSPAFETIWGLPCESLLSDQSTTDPKRAP